VPGWLRCLLGVVVLLVARPCLAWESWGGDPGGSRFSRLREITPDNVGQLVRAFEFHTGDVTARQPDVMRRTKFEATPLFVEDSLIFCSPFNEVIALDPGTGAQKWRFDPKIATSQRPANRYVCRGVTHWVDDSAPEGAACRSRIFMGTNDVRLIALDAKTGLPCANFGKGGEIKLDVGMPLEWPGEFQITSPPVVGHGVIVVGSSIGDNRRVDAPSGVVRAFDARSGEPRWSFEPLKHDGIEAGHANVWAPMSVDGPRGLHDARRGEGSYDRVQDALARLRAHHVPFGFSCMVSAKNHEALTSPEFIASREASGAAIGIFSRYFPLTGESLKDLALDAETLHAYKTRFEAARQRSTLTLLDLDDVEQHTGCHSRAGESIYVDGMSGQISPCLRVPFAPDDCRVDDEVGSLARALSHRFFVEYRNREKSCPTWCGANLSAELAKVTALVAEHGAVPARLPEYEARSHEAGGVKRRLKIITTETSPSRGGECSR